MPGSDTTSDLLRRADQAVLTAKAAGGNHVALFSAEMSLKSEYRNDIELHLQNVIETGALFLRYLPEVDMRTGEVLATEALVRWQHPTRGPAVSRRRSSPSPNPSISQANSAAG